MRKTSVITTLIKRHLLVEQPRKLYIVGFNEDEDSIHNGVNMIKFEYQSVNYPSAEWKLLVCFGEYNWVLSSSGLKSTL